MLKNGQTFIQNLVVFTSQGFESMFDHFSTLCMKGSSFQRTAILLNKSRLLSNIELGILPITNFQFNNDQKVVTFNFCYTNLHICGVT